jgi:hypothetical protein
MKCPYLHLEKLKNLIIFSRTYFKLLTSNAYVVYYIVFYEIYQEHCVGTV